ncbi:MAG: hypothetical protein ACT4OK_09030 [Gemmobacter sp.]
MRPAPDDFTLEVKALYAARSAATRCRAMVRMLARACPNPLVRGLLATEEATLTA